MCWNIEIREVKEQKIEYENVSEGNKRKQIQIARDFKENVKQSGLINGKYFRQLETLCRPCDWIRYLRSSMSAV